MCMSFRISADNIVNNLFIFHLKKVFTNGKISFLNSTISPFELNELNTRTNGTVYHRITYDSSTLAAVTEMIAGSNSALSTRRHRPLYASITTWDRIPLTSYPSITAVR